MPAKALRFEPPISKASTWTLLPLLNVTLWVLETMPKSPTADTKPKTLSIKWPLASVSSPTEPSMVKASVFPGALPVVTLSTVLRTLLASAGLLNP